MTSRPEPYTTTMLQSQPAGAYFEHDLSVSFSSRGAPKYHRTNWEGVNLPRQPSLKQTDYDSFFQLVSCNNPDETEKKHDRFFDFVSRAENVSDSKEYQALAEQECEASAKGKKKHTTVPLRIRKLEIELVQRKLPRYPSKTHLSEPIFYPLASCDLFETLERKKEPSSAAQKMHESDTSITENETECLVDEEDHALLEMHERKMESVSAKMDDDVTSITYIEVESLESEEDLDLSETQEGKNEASPAQMNEEDTTAASSGSYYSDETYYSDSDSDYSEDEVEMEIDDIYEELLELKMMHSQNVEHIDQQQSSSSLSRVDEDIEDSVNNAIGESSRSYVYESRRLSRVDEDIEDSVNDEIGEPSRSYVYESIGESRSYVYDSSFIISEDELHILKIGVVSLPVRAMVIQARMEMRCRKIPKLHKTKFKPSLAQASAVARAKRLDEHTVETCSTRRYAKYDPSVTPSLVWVKGEETVSLPTLNDPVPPQFQIFKEAMALGSIKALKPKITTNYDRLLPMISYHDDQVDVDDATRAKRIRTRYLTDIYLNEDQRERWVDEDEDFESVNYESLDDVELPTSHSPVYGCLTTKATDSELKDLLAQQVAEAVWERRYRLERPRAKQRITYRCYCKYCKTSSMYQTFAYRKKWLIQQKLWKEPPMDDPIKETETYLKFTKELSVDDPIKEMGIKKTSNRTASTRNMSDEVSLTMGSSSDTPRSNSFAIEEFEFSESDTSMILEADEDRFDSEKSSSDFDGASRQHKVSITIPAQPMPKEEKDRKASRKKKSFMREIKSVFGLRQHASH
jgi:hypothetical protein